MAHKPPTITVQSVEIDDLRLRTAFAGCLTLETDCQLRDYGCVRLGAEPYGAPFFGWLHLRYRVEDLRTHKTYDIDDSAVLMRLYPAHESLTRRVARTLRRDGFIVMDYDRNVIEWRYITKGIPTETVELLSQATFVRPHLLSLIAHDPALRKHDFLITDAWVHVKPAPSFFNRSIFSHAARPEDRDRPAAEPAPPAAG
ncbi:MAG: hypothetical protein N2688_04470 [Burkholderiaceae bacterium]|nr:hypothetical protein [Burkholderiaceae bacterium]